MVHLIKQKYFFHSHDWIGSVTASNNSSPEMITSYFLHQ
ncbi:MAG: hypothetical protein OJF59_001069 [Cytophagales bacterium]|nr:MAG: hypothetical protein OJF59_001069 [Cytophagales bacterium]